MIPSTLKRLTVVAGIAWTVVAVCAVLSAIARGDDNWQLAYAVFSMALLVAAVSTVAIAEAATRQSDRKWLRTAGLVVCAVGCLACVVAWALPLWMTLLGVGFALVAAAAKPAQRRPAALLAIAQLAAIPVLIAALELGGGSEDPPGAIALTFLAATTIIALNQLTRQVAGPASGSDVDPAERVMR